MLVHLFVLGLTEQLSEVWHKSVYWQFSDQFNGFKKLADALEDDDIDVQARIYIAREIAALIDRLHSHTFIQNDLKADDIYVKWMHQVFI